jgi:hypothetical protein
MSSKPKKSAYKASETEKASASVAMAQYQRFKQKYDPLLQQMRDASTSEDPTNILRNRAAADTSQALTANLNLRGARSTTDAADYTKGYLSQMGGATTQGKEIQGKLQTNVLSIANQQGADAASGLAQAARTQTGVELSRLADKQMVKNKKLSAVAGLAGSFIGQGLANLGTEGGTFFTPGGVQNPWSLSERARESGLFS